MKTRIIILISIFLALNVNAQEIDTDSSENIMADTILPLVSPYYFQHQYLSVVAPMVDESDGYIFEAPLVLNTSTPIGNGFRSPFADNDIHTEKITVSGKDIFVWRFPEPEYLREALYMVFVPIDGHYKAFAICVGQMVDWEISTSTETSRQTFGRIKKPESAQECVDLLIKLGLLTGEITPGEFIQDGYESPKYRPSTN